MLTCSIMESIHYNKITTDKCSFTDDVDEMGATRYPCMPSLVSLQQMRNRLHLAYLGKKLMKWTALATGRERRRVTQELVRAYENFGEDIREYYILLARARYFCPSLNEMVLENVPRKTSIRVFPSTKTVAGEKIIHYEIVNTGCEPYKHLAIEKGGQVVKNAKDAWMELLKRMILIVELRKAFTQVDEAHRSATKKKNVLAKTVIPRILSSIRYIILELEELAREELYRIKKVVEFKKREEDKIKAKKLQAAKLAEVEYIEDGLQIETVISDIALTPASVLDIPSPIELEDIEPESTPVSVPDIPNPIELEDIEPESTPVSVPDILNPIELEDIEPKSRPVSVPDIPNPIELEDIKPESTPVSVPDIPKPIELEDIEPDISLHPSQSTADYLRDQLASVIALSKGLMNRKIGSIDFNSFLKHCEKVRQGMSETFQAEKSVKLSEDSEKQGLIDDDLNKRLSKDSEKQGLIDDDLNKRLSKDSEKQGLIDDDLNKRLSKDSEKQGLIDDDLNKRLSEKSVKLSEDSGKQGLIDDDLNKRLSEKSVKLSEDSGKQGLIDDDLNKRLSEKSVKLSEDSGKQGLIDDDLNKRLSEKSVKLSEDSGKQGLIDDDLNKRLELLKSHLEAVIDISKEFHGKVNISPSVEGFNNLCQTVKDKLDRYFQDIRSIKVSSLVQVGSSKDQLKYPSSLVQVGSSKDQLKYPKETELTEDSKGISATGSEKFLDASANIKSKIDFDDKNDDKLQDLKDHVTDLEQLTTGIKEDGMTSDSIEGFLLVCKEFKDRIAQYKSEDKTPPSDGKITKLIEQINTAIELSNAAKESGLVTDSVQNFIQSCEDIKKRLEQRTQSQETPQVLLELQDNLEDVINLISELKATGTITTSVENFLKSCQDTKTKISYYGKKQTDDGDSDPEFMYPTYNPSVSPCENDPFCGSCEMWMEEGSATSSGILPIEPRNTRTPTKPKKTSNKKKPMKIITPEKISSDLHYPTDRRVKIIVAKDSESLSEIDDNPTHTCCSRTVVEPQKDEDNLVLEKKVKKIVKVTRTLNKDGTVKEEKEETITTTVTRDQNETDFVDAIDQASETGSQKR